MHSALESTEMNLRGSSRLPRGRAQGFSWRERFNPWLLAPGSVRAFSCSGLPKHRLQFCSRDAEGQAAISPHLSKYPCRLSSCYSDVSNQLYFYPTSASPLHSGAPTTLLECKNKWKYPFLQTFTKLTMLGPQLLTAPFLWIMKY